MQVNSLCGERGRRHWLKYSLLTSYWLATIFMISVYRDGQKCVSLVILVCELANQTADEVLAWISITGFPDIVWKPKNICCYTQRLNFHQMTAD